MGTDVVVIKDNKEISLAVRGVGRFKLSNQFSVSWSRLHIESPRKIKNIDVWVPYPGILT